MQNQLYKYLERKESFIPLLNQFLARSIEDEYADQDRDIGEAIPYAAFYDKFITDVSLLNADNVFNYCQSPIEKVFLNSLMLLFIKNRMPCLYITPPFSDAPNNIEAFVAHGNRIEDFIKSYKINTGDTELLHFEKRLNEKRQSGKLSDEEVADVLMYMSIRKPFEWNSYHITPQASFPSLKINNKGIRVDLFIWVPGDPSVKIVVECDGFEYHKSKEMFISDRGRDRLLQLNGYRIIRYSGTEINMQPVEVSSNLFDLLIALDSNSNDSRVM